MTDKPKLEPCPWCKKIPDVDSDSELDVSLSFQICCWNDDCLVNPKSKWSATLENAVEDWNTRAPTDFEAKARELLYKAKIALSYRDDYRLINAKRDIEKFLEENGDNN